MLGITWRQLSRSTVGVLVEASSWQLLAASEPHHIWHNRVTS
jgi:hypothetical protein